MKQEPRPEDFGLNDSQIENINTIYRNHSSVDEYIFRTMMLMFGVITACVFGYFHFIYAERSSFSLFFTVLFSLLGFMVGCFPGILIAGLIAYLREQILIPHLKKPRSLIRKYELAKADWDVAVMLEDSNIIKAFGAYMEETPVFTIDDMSNALPYSVGQIEAALQRQLRDRQSKREIESIQGGLAMLQMAKAGKTAAIIAFAKANTPKNFPYRLP